MSDPISQPDRTAEQPLESWKEIAAYLGKGVRTVVRWEKNEGLPVHRHMHERRSSVFAYRSEIDVWWQSRRMVLEKDVPEAPADQPELPTHRFRWLWLTALIPVVVSAIWFLRPAASRTVHPPFSFEQLTAYPGNQSTLSFSPDGNYFAFAWNPAPGQGNLDIYVQAVGSSEPKRLTEHPFWEFSPAWSPDGKWIAFFRRSPQYKIELLLIPALGGQEHKLADLKTSHYMDAPQLSWSPDGKRLAFADDDPDGYGIFSFSVETRDRFRLTKVGDFRGDLDPAFSPDGRHLAFRRNLMETTSEIYILPLTAEGRPQGEPEMITQRGIRSTSPVWSADGKQIFFSSGIFYAGNSDLHRVQVFPRTSIPPERLTNGIGDDYFCLATCWRAGLLACTRKQSDINIHALVKGPQGWQKSDDMRMLSSTRTDQDPAFSLDGQKIAFVSSRSGNLELWVAHRDGSRQQKITSLNAPMISSPRWSPDGKHLTFTVRRQDVFSIWITDAIGDTARQLVEQGYEPSWSSDGRWIYYNDRSSKVVKIPSGGGTPVTVVEAPSGLLGESKDGRSLYFLAPVEKRPALWRRSLPEGKQQLMTKELSFPLLGLTDDGIFMASRSQPPIQHKLLFHRFADNVTEELPVIGPQLAPGFAVAPDGKTILYAQTDHETTSLMMIRGLW